MLLWEALTRPREPAQNRSKPVEPVLCPQRLPYDRRCATVTKSGKRCRGRIRSGSEYCGLHDPALAESRQTRKASRTSAGRRRLSHLPDGYLRKLSNRATVGSAMDRLYRELRLGIVSTEMGSVLFGILTRLLDGGWVDSGVVAASAKRRSRADRLRPKLAELLTRGERIAWQRAVANAPLSVVQANESRAAKSTRVRIEEAQRADLSDTARLQTLQAAS